MEREEREVISLLAHWGFSTESVGAITPVLDVYRVETAQGPMNLKWTRHPDDKLLFIISALNYLAERGFHQLCLPLPTKDGRPFLVHDNQHYLLFRWIEGRQADWAQLKELVASCQLLARFHRASRGFKPPPGNPIRARWGQMLDAFAKRCHELEQLTRIMPDDGHFNRFELKVRREVDYYLALAHFALNLLDSSSYRDLASRGAEEGGLCHGDIAARNFIWTPTDEVHLIDFDGIRQDIPLMDLWKLFRRVMKKFNWQIELGAQIIEAYESISPLSARELEVLLALTSFPEKYWRLANRYYSGRFRGEEMKFYRKLRKYTAQRKTHAAFLGYLARFCRERGVNSTWPSYPFATELSHQEVVRLSPKPWQKGQGSGNS